ncbi:MAG: SIS domain-containing protein [Bacteroidetes bacterium]|nr:SIS domain-containing protein [Bacteroidota bacterium]
MIMFTDNFLSEIKSIVEKLDNTVVEKMAKILVDIRNNQGRVFFIGSGGGAGHASHAVCDFRKLCNIESYAAYDNVSELTARVNDEGWDSTILNWLKVSNLNSKDCLFVFSVGGGSADKNISNNIVKAVQYIKEKGGKVVGVVGKDGGFTKEAGDAVVVIPTINENHITPLTEGFQAVIWHLLVSHPLLQINPTKWESTN